MPLSVCGCPPCLKCDTRTHRHTCTVCLNRVSVCHSDSVWAVRNEVTGAVWDLQLELLSNITFTLWTKSFKPQPRGLCSEISAAEDLQDGRAWYHLLSVRCEQLYRFMVTTNQSVPLLKRGLSHFLWHSGQLIYQCLISCFGHSQLLLFCLLPSLASLGIYSLSLSLCISILAAVVAALLSFPEALYRSLKIEKMKWKWREMEEPPVTSSPWSCMATRVNLLHFWFQSQIIG